MTTFVPTESAVAEAVDAALNLESEGTGVSEPSMSILWAEHNLLRELRARRTDRSENQLLRCTDAAVTLAKSLLAKHPDLAPLMKGADHNRLLDLAYRVSVL